MGTTGGPLWTAHRGGPGDMRAGSAARRRSRHRDDSNVQFLLSCFLLFSPSYEGRHRLCCEARRQTSFRLLYDDLIQRLFRSPTTYIVQLLAYLFTCGNLKSRRESLPSRENATSIGIYHRHTIALGDYILISAASFIWPVSAQIQARCLSNSMHSDIESGAIMSSLDTRMRAPRGRVFIT